MKIKGQHVLVGGELKKTKCLKEKKGWHSLSSGWISGTSEYEYQVTI